MVAPISEYTAELLEHAANNMKGLLRPEVEEDAKLVQKGLLLYRQGLVYGLRFDGELVTASVQDVTSVQVKLDLNFINTSECSCPADGFCRHILAVFFHALAKGGSVSDWVEGWRQPLRAKTVAVNLGLKTARDLLKTSKKPESSYEDWKTAFYSSFRMILYGQGDPKPYVVNELFRVYWRRIKADAPVKLEWRMLYELIASVQSFNMLAGMAMEAGHSEYMVDRYYRHIFLELMEEIESVMDKLSVHSLPFAFDQFIERMKDDAADLLSGYRGLDYEGTHLYRLLWSQIFKKKAWRDAERERLEAQLRENADRGQPEGNTDQLPLMIGMIHQAILAKKDEQALALLNQLDINGQPYYLYWLEQFTGLRDWKRSAPFIEQFVGRLNRYLQVLRNYDACTDFTRLAVELVAPYCIETGRDDLMERTLVQSLPYSFRVYDSFLFSQKLYAKWAELQAFIGVEMDYLGTTDRIKVVQKGEPAALLPLYHQAIQKNIDSKNRSSYREAVKLLKKLRTIYKKMDRLEEWDRFFEKLLSNTKRLRAFQEECIRGKLVNA